MPKTLSNREVCERALRKIGAYSMIDDEADPDELEEATYWLDMVIAHTVGSHHCKWLVPANIPLALTAGEVSFDLQDRAGTNWPIDGIFFPLHGFVRDATGHDEPVKIERRVIYDAIDDKDASGRPVLVYIDRTLKPQVFVHPVPAESGLALHLTGQRLSPDLAAKGNTASNINAATDLRATWNLWAVMALAHRIGAGPVRRLPADEVREMREEAERLLLDLNAFDNREHAGEYRGLAFTRM